jgi:hypothetical protein
MLAKRHIAFPIAAVCWLLSQAWASPATTQNTSVPEVWAREEAYWRFVQAGNVDEYLTLWHERFVGWPCTAAHPATKASIGNCVRDIRDKKARFTYSLTREEARDFGSMVVVYYRTPMVWEYPDGRVEKRGDVFKFTHTWLKVGSTWQIIGGMCGALQQTE